MSMKMREKETILLEIFETKLTILNVMGRYSLENRKFLYPFLTIWVFACVVLYLLCEAHTIFLQSLSIEESFQVLPYLVIVFQDAAKLSIAYHKKNVFGDIESKLVQLSVTYDFDKADINVIRSTFQSIEPITRIFRATEIGYIIYIAFSPLIDHEVHTLKKFPADSNTTSGFWINFICQFLLASTCAHSCMSLDISVYKLMTIGGALFKILIHKLKRIDYSKETEKHFGRLISLHNDVLDISQLIEEFSSFISLVQVSGSIFLLAIIFVKIISMPLAMDAMFFLIIVLTQTAVYCGFADWFTQQTQELGTALYMSDWHTASLKQKKNMAIFMERVKRPVNLTAGKFVYLSFGLFGSILKTAYSYFAVIVQHI